MIEIYEALDDLHIEITCSDDGLDWFWRNTDTGQESDWTHETAREALLQAAQDFNISLDQSGDEEDDEYDDDSYDDSMDGDHESALASAGWGTDDDYGGFDDRM